MPQVIDLTLTAYHGMRGVEIYQNTTAAVEGFNTTNLHLYSHSGTHMDAPLHFIDDGNTIDKVDLRKCTGPAIVVDVTHVEPRDFITVDDLGEQTSKIEPKSRVLLNTGWAGHAERPDYRTHFPRISIELAEWFTKKGIWLVGIEMPSVASLLPEDKEELTDVHQTLLRAEIVIVESLTNLDKLPPVVHFTALPLKVKNGDGSPVRAIAVI